MLGGLPDLLLAYALGILTAMALCDMAEDLEREGGQ